MRKYNLVYQLLSEIKKWSLDQIHGSFESVHLIQHVFEPYEHQKVMFDALSKYFEAEQSYYQEKHDAYKFLEVIKDVWRWWDCELTIDHHMSNLQEDVDKWQEEVDVYTEEYEAIKNSNVSFTVEFGTYFEKMKLEKQGVKIPSVEMSMSEIFDAIVNQTGPKAPEGSPVQNPLVWMLANCAQDTWSPFNENGDGSLNNTLSRIESVANPGNVREIEKQKWGIKMWESEDRESTAEAASAAGYASSRYSNRILRAHKQFAASDIVLDKLKQRKEKIDSTSRESWIKQRMETRDYQLANLIIDLYEFDDIPVYSARHACDKIIKLFPEWVSFDIPKKGRDKYNSMPHEKAWKSMVEDFLQYETREYVEDYMSRLEREAIHSVSGWKKRVRDGSYPISEKAERWYRSKIDKLVEREEAKL